MKHVQQTIFAALLFAAPLALAQAPQPYPTKPIRMLVGFTAGSEVDLVGRTVAQKIAESWGHQIVVENRPGAAGTLAGALAAAAPPDGYTLFLNTVAHGATPALYPKLSYNVLRDFTGISQLTSASNVLVIAPNQGPKSVKELIAVAKQKPGQLNYGSAGVGSGSHITGELFKLMAQIDVAHIPYKGTIEQVTDTTTGRVHYSFIPIGGTLPFVKDKRLLALAVSTAQRAPALPEVPTVAEAGLPGFEFDHWYGVFAPAKTPRPIVTKLSQEIGRVLALSDVRNSLMTRGAAPKSSTPEEFDRFVRASVEMQTKVINTARIKVE